MNKNNDHKILEAMEIYGGSFASAIARAANHADHFNYQRLRAAFPDLWEEYTEMAEQLERNRSSARAARTRDEDAAKSLFNKKLLTGVTKNKLSPAESELLKDERIKDLGAAVEGLKHEHIQKIINRCD